MREQEDGARLNHLNLFNLDRLDVYNNFEAGSSATLGFDYEIKNSDQKFKLTAGQVINQKENKDMPSSTSLDTKLSDFVGNSSLEFNDKLKLNYNFALGENYKDLNYNDFGANFTFDKIKFNINYLEEKSI